MSNEGRFRDYNGNVQTAGKITAIKEESGKSCINPNPTGRPGTPPNLQKYRKSHMQQVGTTIVHYGKYDDNLPKNAHTYGLELKPSDHMLDCVKNKNTEGYSKVINNINEEIYISTIKEPLGKRMDRHYVYPEKCNGGEFRFGHPTIESANTVKDLLQTGFTLNEEDSVKKQYLKSHGNYQPAEQKNREYNWPFNHENHEFGKREKVIRNEAQQCLQPERLNCEDFPKTKVVKKNIEDFRDFNQDTLGRPRNLGQTDMLIDPNKIFGINPKQGDQWHAKECLKGDATFKECYSDPNLGRATKFGFRNQTRRGDENRVFGVPTIRDDVIRHDSQSVACTQNYGNEPRAVDLQFPHGYNHYGLDMDDLEKRRFRNEIREIFANIGITYNAGKFEGVWLRACKIEGVSRGTDSDSGVCVKSFLQAVKEMDTA